jgi:hypothetical protein
MVVRTRSREARARAPESRLVLNRVVQGQAAEETIGHLRYCAPCSCVTSHASGACEYQEWHESPRYD